MSARAVRRPSRRDEALRCLAHVERYFRQAQRKGLSPKINDGFSARLCYRNALHLYRSGVDLGRRQDFGAARSLLILSIEELAKAVAYEMIYLGAFATRKGRQRGLISLDRRCFKCHVCKHELVFRIKVGMDAAEMLGKMASIKGLFKEARTQEQAIAALPTVMRDFTSGQVRTELASSLAEQPEAWRELGRVFSAASDMEHAKQLGFYVEGWERPPTAPQQVTSKDFEKVRLFIEKRLVEFFPLLAEEVPPEWRRRTKEIVGAVAAALWTREANRRVPAILCTHSKHQLASG